ncbi:unnamed protein product, partial [Rotaria sordida]
KKSAHKNE